VQKVTQAAFFV